MAFILLGNTQNDKIVLKSNKCKNSWESILTTRRNNSHSPTNYNTID